MAFLGDGDDALCKLLVRFGSGEQLAPIREVPLSSAESMASSIQSAVVMWRWFMSPLLLQDAGQ
jgi:hypothetical protein